MQLNSFHYLLLVLITVLTLGSCGDKKTNANESPEAVGEAFFKLLAENNPAGLKALFPGEDDWESMAKITRISPDKIDGFKKDFIHRIRMTHTNEVSRFNILQDRSRDLNLKEAELREVVKVREWTKEGLELANVEIRFLLGNDQDTILLGNIGKLDRGWFMNRVPNWKPGE